MSAPRIGVGLVGWGLAGRFLHAPFIVAETGFELTRVVTSRAVDPVPFPGAERTDSLEQLLDDPAIDLVVITSPNRFHVPQALAALERGKHVVLEKPVAPDVASLRRLIAAAQRAGRLLIPFQNRRWDGDFRTVAEIVRSGVLGDVHLYSATWHKYQPVPRFRAAWKGEDDPMNGPLFDLGPHLVDQAIVLFGRPERVLARIETRRAGGPVHDWFRLDLEFASGVRTVLEVDHLNPFDAPRHELRGSKGSFQKFGIDPQEARLCAGDTPSGDDWGTEVPESWGRLVAQNHDGTARDEPVPTLPGDWRPFYRAVHSAIALGTPPPVATGDVVTQLEVFEAALRSSRSRRTEDLPTE